MPSVGTVQREGKQQRTRKFGATHRIFVSTHSLPLYLIYEKQASPFVPRGRQVLINISTEQRRPVFFGEGEGREGKADATALQRWLTRSFECWKASPGSERIIKRNAAHASPANSSSTVVKTLELLCLPVTQHFPLQQPAFLLESLSQNTS